MSTLNKNKKSFEQLELEQLEKNIKKLEKRNKNKKQIAVTVTPEGVNLLASEGKIPKDVETWYLKDQAKRNKRHQDFIECMSNNQHIPEANRGIVCAKKSMDEQNALELLDPQHGLKEAYRTVLNLDQLFEIFLKNQPSPVIEFSSELTNKFFESIAPEEYSMSRLVADPLNHLAELLDGFDGVHNLKDGFYAIESQVLNSLGDELKLNYRFQAINESDAIEKAEAFIYRMKRRQLKVYEACWALASKKLNRIVKCDLTEIMEIAYPNRSSRATFTTDEKIEFYQDLLDLSETKFTLKKAAALKLPPKSKKITIFIFPLITIFDISDCNIKSDNKSDRYPNDLSFSVVHNPNYEKEKMYNLGAIRKLKILELRHEDTRLATHISTRKSQLMKKDTITFTDREWLFKLANLDDTNPKYKKVANQRLLEKFARLQDTGTIISYPKRVIFPFTIKIK